MRISANLNAVSQQQKLYKLNQSTSQAGAMVKESMDSNGNYKTDRITISPMGKAMNMMESLMKQKESINQRKHELIEKTLEHGGNMRGIQDQLDAYDESMKLIDEQISTLMEDTLKSQAEDPDEEKQKMEDAPETEEEVQAEQLKGHLSLATDLDSLKIVKSASDKAERGIKSKEAEIARDRTYGPVSERKLEQLDEMKEHKKALSSQFGQILGDVQETVSANVQAAEKAGEAQAAAENPEAVQETPALQETEEDS